MVQPDEAVIAALTKGGMWSVGEANPARETEGPGKYNAAIDPPGAEMLGKKLAATVASLGATCILLQEDEPPDLVLAHVVARELGVTAARASNRDGLIDIAGHLGPDERVLIVADAIRDERVVDALRAAVDRAGSAIAGFAVLVKTQSLEARARPDESVSFLATEPLPHG